MLVIPKVFTIFANVLRQQWRPITNRQIGYNEHRVRNQYLFLQQKQKDMPTNKNALIRYKYLDRLLSDHHHYYDIHDLTEKVNEYLDGERLKTVTQRCIEKDLLNMQGLFCAPIEHEKKNGKKIRQRL